MTKTIYLNGAFFGLYLRVMIVLLCISGLNWKAIGFAGKSAFHAN
jgi:hypothetical protein